MKDSLLNMIDVEIIKPPENEYLNFLCIYDSAFSSDDRRILRIKLSSLKTRKLYFYYNDVRYRLIAYER